MRMSDSVRKLREIPGAPASLCFDQMTQELPKAGCGEELHVEPQGETRKSDKRDGET